MQMEGSFNGASEHGSSTDDSQIVLALRQMMKKEIEVIVIRTIHQVIGPIVENLIRKVVKEEILSAQEKFLTGGNRNQENEPITSQEKNLELKFLDDEVCEPVLSGKEIKGKGGTPITVALVDKITNQVVDCGPGSSEKVEIVVLDVSEDDNEQNWSHEEFNSRIIKEGDKKKPHFSKSNYIYLKGGKGSLNNPKLGNDSIWTKSCKCRLGARIVGNFDGVKVQEAWTKSFMVYDSRSKLYEKHYPPFLLDDIWRLKNIGKDGAPCKNLNKMNILTVKDFLFLQSVDPEKLQKIAAGAKGKASIAKWKATVDHAQTCIIDDNKIYRYCPSSDSKMGVTFDVVGGLKGLIRDSQYVPIVRLSEDEKARARKLIRSAYENQKDITCFVDEASLQQQYPCRSSDFSDCNIETIDGYDDTEPGTSHQSLIPSFRPLEHSNSFRHCGLLESITIPHLGVSNQAPDWTLSDLGPGTSSQSMNTILHFGSLDSIPMGRLNDAHLEGPIGGPLSDLAPGTSSQSMNTILHFGSLDSIPIRLLNDAHLEGPIGGPLSDLVPGTSQNIEAICGFDSMTMARLNDAHLEGPIEGPLSDLVPGTSSQNIEAICGFDSMTMARLNDAHLESPIGGPLSDLAPGTSSQNIEAICGFDSMTMAQFNGPSSVSDLEQGASSRFFGQENDTHLGVCSLTYLEPVNMEQLNDPHLGVLYRAPRFSYSDLEPGTSSQSLNTIRGFGPLGSPTMGQPNEPYLPAYQGPSCSFNDFERSGDNENLVSETNNIPQTVEAGSHSHQQSNITDIHLIEVTDVILWMVRARNRCMALKYLRPRRRLRMH